MALMIVVGLSILVQLGAAVLALRLVRTTGRRAAWTLIALAIFLMAVRRVIPLYQILSGAPAPPHDLVFEIIGLVISFCMLAGIAWIAPIFEAIRSHAEELRRSEEKFRRIVDTAQEGVWFIDAAGTTSYVNRRMTDLVGWTAEAIRGRPITEVFEESSCAEVMRRLGAPGAEKAVHHDCRLRRKDGATVWAIVSANPMFDDAGRPFGALAMITDISERKRMEREREVLIGELQTALASVKTLKGLLRVCAWCNRIQDENGDWSSMEVYLRNHADANFSHGICPQCSGKL